MASDRVPDPPQFPAGPYVESGPPTERQRDAWIGEIEALPEHVRSATAGLAEVQLDTTYRNWTIRQIVHHLADSHLNSYVRIKLALTEDRPTIKPYDESRWSALDDARRAPIGPSLEILDGVHARWAILMRSLPAEAFDREFYHPETNVTTPLWKALALYGWHGRHHTAQIEWVLAHKL
jgi:uncharacterized damage-inducible protein DinB